MFSAEETEEHIHRGKKSFIRKRPRLLVVPGLDTKTGSGLNANFLSGPSNYVLGFKTEDANPERTNDCFAAFRRLHEGAELQIGCPEFSAVCAFLRSWKPSQARLHPELEALATHRCVFRIQGLNHRVHDSTLFQKWWLGRLEDDAPPIIGQCLVTGNAAPIARLHEPKIRGFESTGSLLVSFNDAAYTSYRPDHAEAQALAAPVSKAVTFRYTTALNALLAGPNAKKHSVDLGDTKTVFWTEDPSPMEPFFAELLQGHESDVSAPVQDEPTRRNLELFFKSLRSGGADNVPTEFSASASFFVLSLTGQAKGRLGVRAWHQTTVGDLTNRLFSHFNAIACEAPAEHFRKLPTFQDFLDQTAPLKKGSTDRERIPPGLSGSLLRSVLLGADYPFTLAQSIIRRIRADRFIDPIIKMKKIGDEIDARRRAYLRASFLKGFLNRNHQHTIAMSLNPAYDNPAYQLGRLFAVLEKTQQDALGAVNSGIRDRYYGAASATPNVVFGRLLKLHQHHLPKAEASLAERYGPEGGRKIRAKIERDVGEIMAAFRAAPFPAHLGLEGQSLFALGYYHQRQAFYTKTDAEAQPAA